MTSELHLPSIDTITSCLSPRIIVCRGRSCRRYHAEQVIDEFHQKLPSEVELITVPCLGQCGNGPMVLIESDQTWYSEVSPQEVVIIIDQHIINHSAVKEMLYPKFHPHQ